MEKVILNSIEEIKKAVDDGHDVYCGSDLYVVKRDLIHKDFRITCTLNSYQIGLHGMEGTEYENKLNSSGPFYYYQ
jgi:hypothetical protein